MWKKEKLFESLTPFTLLDFQGLPSAILWFHGCNMRCEYCYNPEIVLGNGEFTFKDFKGFFYSRKGLLKGIVLCGGEPTLHKEIIPLCYELKTMGYKIKLDTNGTKPKIVKNLIESDLVDYIALDFKAPKNKFSTLTKSQEKEYENFLETLEMLINSSIEYEVRTTFYGGLLDFQDIEKMCNLLEELSFHKKYYLQNALCDTATLGNILENTLKIEQNDITFSSKYSFEVIVR